jgi:hypothetical protein
MKLENMPRMEEELIEDLRDKKPPSPMGDGKGDLEQPDKRLIEDPENAEGNIGYEMQPAMRGYGKVTKSLNQWRVR